MCFPSSPKAVKFNIGFNLSTIKELIHKMNEELVIHVSMYIFFAVCNINMFCYFIQLVAYV